MDFWKVSGMTATRLPMAHVMSLTSALSTEKQTRARLLVTMALIRSWLVRGLRLVSSCRDSYALARPTKAFSSRLMRKFMRRVR